MEPVRVDLWEEGEYTYPAAFGFRPNLRLYLHDDEEVRPCVLVIPGGGYRYVSPSEGEIVAKCFFEKGYQTMVGTYTVNCSDLVPLKTQPLQDLARMVRVIRKNAEAWRVDPARVVLCGFSAGAHACGSLCVFWKEAQEKNGSYASFSCRPDGAILSYPVITSGPSAHRDSFNALLGEAAGPEELRKMSLEYQVTPDTPPVFLWQTANDGSVPVENSYLMAQALKVAGVPFAHHVFPRGQHGLSLSNRDWENRNFGEPYTLEQNRMTAEAALKGEVQLPPVGQEILAGFLHPECPPAMKWTNVPVREAAVWPDLADCWMQENIT